MKQKACFSENNYIALDKNGKIYILMDNGDFKEFDQIDKISNNTQNNHQKNDDPQTPPPPKKTFTSQTSTASELAKTQKSESETTTSEAKRAGKYMAGGIKGMSSGNSFTKTFKPNPTISSQGKFANKTSPESKKTQNNSEEVEKSTSVTKTSNQTQSKAQTTETSSTPSETSQVNPKSKNQINEVNTVESKAFSKSKIDGTILFNCDKSKFLIFANKKLQIYDCSLENKMICNANQYLKQEITNIKWSYYSPNIFAYITQSTIVICQLVPISNDKDNLMEIHQRIIKPGFDQSNAQISAFAWGDSCNVWLKYSIVYYLENKQSLYLLRPATPNKYPLPFKDFIKMSSTLDAQSSTRFSSSNKTFYVEKKGTTRILNIPDKASEVVTEIPLDEQIKTQIYSIYWVNSYLSCYLILIDADFVIYIVSIQEVDDFINDFSNSNYLSFISTNNTKFRPCNLIKKIDTIKSKYLNFTFSNGIFFNTGNKLYRLFLKRRSINQDNVNNISNVSINDNEIDEDSIFDIPDINDPNEDAKLKLLAKFEDIRGAYGNILLLNKFKAIKIGQYPDSIKRVDVVKASPQDIDKYIKKFDRDVIDRRLQLENKETQRLQVMEQIIQNETDYYIRKQEEIKNLDDELEEVREQAEQVEKEMKNLIKPPENK